MKKEWTPSTDTFRQFLNWLDNGVESDGEKYLEMRRRLVLYFDRKNCLTPDELADETLARVARKLAEQGSITDLSPAHYCYITARFVFLEYLRGAEHGKTSIEGSAQPIDVRGVPSIADRDETAGTQDELLARLESCLENLATADRELILEYYNGEGRTKIENRRVLAQRFGLSANALTIRACRIRNKIEECVRKSLPPE